MTLEKIINDSLKNKYGELNDVLKLRIKDEIEMIYKLDLETYFIKAHRLAKISKNDNYEYEYRGNLGNSVIAYILDITDVDPLYYNLPYELSLHKDLKPIVEFHVASDVYEKTLNELNEIEIEIFERPEFGKVTIIDLNYKYLNSVFEDIESEDYLNEINEFIPSNYDELLHYYALKLGNDVWESNGYYYFKNRNVSFTKIIATSEQIYEILLNANINKDKALNIAVLTKGLRTESKQEDLRLKLKDLEIEDWIKESILKSTYYFPKSHVISSLNRRIRNMEKEDIYHDSI